jgi:hypothetical protein
MPPAGRPIAFWFIVAFLASAILLMLVGQTLGLVDYDLATRLGLQETHAEVGEFGIQINRAFAAGDTLVYIPLLVLALVGLLLRKRWALLMTAAAFGVSLYWAVTVVFLLAFLRSVPGYTLAPGPEYWLYVGGFIVVGAWGLIYLMVRGDRLLAIGETFADRAR